MATLLCPNACSQVTDSSNSKERLKPGKLATWRERLAKQMVAERLNSGVRVSDLATACVMSRSHFSRAFKLSTGMSPRAWIHRQRISKAKQLMTWSPLSLTQIGAECGFCDQAHFYRSFLKSEGLAPK
jgi:transcriptional regulator GlxA family with amidase domain